MSIVESEKRNRSKKKRNRKNRSALKSTYSKVSEWNLEGEFKIQTDSPGEIIESLEESIRTAVENRDTEESATEDVLKPNPAVSKFKKVIEKGSQTDEG